MIVAVDGANTLAADQCRDLPNSREACPELRHEVRRRAAKRQDMHVPAVRAPAVSKLPLTRHQEMRRIVRLLLHQRLDQREQRRFAAAQADIGGDEEEGSGVGHGKAFSIQQSAVS